MPINLESLCAAVDCDKDELKRRMEKLFEDGQGKSALEWLKDQIQTCMKERKKYEKREDDSPSFILKAKMRKGKSEVVFLEDRWTNKVMSEIGFQYKEHGKKGQWRIPKSMEAKTLQNVLLIFEMLTEEIRTEMESKKSSNVRRDVLQRLKRKREIKDDDVEERKQDESNKETPQKEQSQR